MPRRAERRRRRPARPPLGAAQSRFAAPTQARLLAARVLERVERARAYADLTLTAALARSALGPRDRAFTTELVYGTLRWRGRLDCALGQVLERPLASVEPGVVTLLRLGAYQLLFCDVPASAAVDQTVRSAHALGASRAAGLVNAVLRRLAQRAGALAFPALEDEPLAHLEHALGIPRWIAERWLAALGPSQAAALAAASNAPPPLTVRANRARIGRAALLARLVERFPEAQACAFAPDGVVLGHGGSPASDPDFVAGLFTVQDEASQLVVELLAPAPGERVLDACAAPGTKTTAIAERVGPDGLVVALDRSERRLALIGRAVRRLGQGNVTALAADATQALAELPGAPFDRVLVDAPCSGLGALRRNPDARWRLSPDDPAQLAELQSALLASASTWLRPGGTLVYSTCTLTGEENDAVVEAFLANTPGFERAEAGRLPQALRPLLDAKGALVTWPHRHGTGAHGMDGFYAARLERSA
jgi:16S rRNA (cytosine967-C5)-methyltransferase